MEERMMPPGQARAERAKKLLPFFLLAVLAVSLMPELALGRYARGAADDYCYGIFTLRALREGRGLWSGVWETMWDYYHSWQGSFAALGLMSLTPCIFSEQLYFLTPAVMLLSLIVGTAKLTDTLVRRGLGEGWRTAVCLWAPMLLWSIQLLPNPHDSFYWWNGAIYYTFTYGISLLYTERFVTLTLAKELDGRVSAAVLIPGAVWGVLIGGSNYVSALLCAMLGACFTLWAFFRKRGRWQAVVLLLEEMVPFLASVAAPGNQVRQAASAALSPVEAIFRSILRAGWDGLHWGLRGSTLLLMALLAPLLFRLAGKSRVSFRLPALFMVFTFLVFAGQNAPHYYALSEAGPPRLRNIVYFSFYWLILLNEWYLLGWFRRRVLPRLSVSKEGMLRLRRAAVVCLAVLTVWGGICALPGTFWAECLRELSDGSAAAYAQQRDERLPVLEDSGITDPVFPPIQPRPPLLYHSDITTDPANWENNVLAMYFGKNSVTLQGE